MNWYKKLMLSSYDWDKMWHKLRKKLKRDPNNNDVQKEMLNEFFTRKHESDSEDEYNLPKNIKNELE